MKNLKIRTVIFALLIFLIALSGYLTYSHEKGEELGICISGNGSSPCSDVQNTPYGSFLGVKVCHWGLLAFIIMLIIYTVASTQNQYYKPTHKLFTLLAFIGSLISLYFIFVQFFILKTLCSICLIIDFSTILVFILAYVEFHIKKKRWYSI